MTTTDRRDATDEERSRALGQWIRESRTSRPHRDARSAFLAGWDAALKPAPGTDTSTEDALHRVLDLADQWESDAARADDAEPATRDDLSRMISASRWSRQHAAEVRDAIAGPQRDQPVADWERELIHARCGASGCDCR